MNMKLLKHLILSGLLLFVCIGCDEKAPDVVTQAESYCLDERFRQQITLDTVEMRAVTHAIPLTGRVEDNPDKVVHFVSLIDGIISKTYFSLGDEVRKGQVLAELRSTELSNLQSELRNMRSQIQVAERNLQSVQSMYDDGISSERDLLDAQTQLDIYNSKAQKIKDNLALFSGSAERGVFQIKAPMSGIVTSNFISTGTQITSEGEPLFTISDLREVWVMVNIYATNVQHIDAGMAVEIKSLSYPDLTFEGEISAVSQVLDKDAKVLKARIVLDNSDLKLKPGMLVEVVALQKRNMEAIAIPTHALVFDNNRNYVVVYKDDCDMEIREVDILSASNGLTFIKDGLSESDRIISKNALLVYEQLNN